MVLLFFFVRFLKRHIFLESYFHGDFLTFQNAFFLVKNIKILKAETVKKLFPAVLALICVLEQKMKQKKRKKESLLIRNMERFGTFLTNLLSFSETDVVFG